MQQGIQTSTPDGMDRGMSFGSAATPTAVMRQQMTPWNQLATSAHRSANSSGHVSGMALGGPSFLFQQKTKPNFPYISSSSFCHIAPM